MASLAMMRRRISIGIYHELDGWMGVSDRKDNVKWWLKMEERASEWKQT